MKKRRIVKITNKIVNKIEFFLTRMRVVSKPINLDIVLTKRCNLRCVFCKNYETEGQQDISLEDFKLIAQHLFPSASTVSFCSGGEPHLNRDLVPILRICKDYGLYVWLLSNGMPINEDVIRAIVQDGLVSEHGFSIDAATKETLEGIRLGANFKKIINNIERFISLKKSLKKNEPLIHIRYVIMRKNIEELPDAVYLFNKLGVDKITADHISICNDVDEHESLFYHQELTNKIFREIKKAKNLKIKIALPSIDTKNNKILKCARPWYFVMIDTNGNILPCYKSWGYLKMGNISSCRGSAFSQLWNSKDYQKLRDTVNDESKIPFYPYCHKCEVRYPHFDLNLLLGQKHFIEVMGEYNTDFKNLNWRR